MAEKRDQTTAFAARKSEKERIRKVAKFLDIGMSEYMREAVMKEVTKQEKRM